MKRALITGITGQDGSYLAELLLRKNYQVHGIKRRSSSFNTGRIDHILTDWHEHPRLTLHFADLDDSSSIMKLVHDIQPDEVYNLAAQSHVRASFDIPEYTCGVTGLGCLRLLEAIRMFRPTARFYQASSSEMFGSSAPPQSESTIFHPRSPYACAKLFAHATTINYRESYGIFASSGILFNHESPRRGETFVTRKIARAAARISRGLQSTLYMGNIDARRDWGYAPDFVEAMWLMLQLEKPADYVIGTGTNYSVRDFLSFCFAHVSLDWNEYVRIDPAYFRPAEVDSLRADPTKGRRELGWSHRVETPELARIMVDSELASIDRPELTHGGSQS